MRYRATTSEPRFQPIGDKYAIILKQLQYFSFFSFILLSYNIQMSHWGLIGVYLYDSNGDKLVL